MTNAALEEAKALLAREAGSTLPNELCVLSVEFLFSPSAREKYEEASDRCMSEDIRYVFGEIGRVVEIGPKDISSFSNSSSPKGARIRVDIVGSKALVELLLKKMQEESFALHIEHWTYGPEGFLISNNLLHLQKELMAPWVGLASFEFKKLAARWCGDPGDENYPHALLPGSSFPFADWMCEAAVTEAEATKFLNLVEVSAGLLHTMAKAVERAASPRPKNTFLVPGLIPDGAPTLLLGNRKAGKSTALLELSVAVDVAPSSYPVELRVWRLASCTV